MTARNIFDYFIYDDVWQKQLFEIYTTQPGPLSLKLSKYVHWKWIITISSDSKANAGHLSLCLGNISDQYHHNITNVDLLYNLLDLNTTVPSQALNN